MKNAPRYTAVGLRTVYPEKHENSTAWDDERGKTIECLWVFVQIVHVLDVYITACMQRSTTCFIFVFALR